jgi:hypothetical protein
MSDHEEINSILPEYVVGGLDAGTCQSIEAHLATCAECRADLALWQTVSENIIQLDQAVPFPKNLVDEVLKRKILPGSRPNSLSHSWGILKSQVPLVRHEIWPASTIIMIIGYIAAILVGKEEIIQVLAPLVAATSIAMLYGPENDPGMELMYSIPGSPRQILLARLVIVFSYNFTLAMIASVCLLPVFPGLFLKMLILSWLAPMTFLSALAFLLSIYLGAENAIIAAYFVWILQYVSRGAESVSLFQKDPLLTDLLSRYAHLWQQPTTLFIAAGILLAGALWSVSKVEFHPFHLV